VSIVRDIAVSVDEGESLALIRQKPEALGSAVWSLS